MGSKLDYCGAKALEYTRRAEETTDKEVREFLYRLRDIWIIAANGRKEGTENNLSGLIESASRR